jgi:hypothetical protein
VLSRTGYHDEALALLDAAADDARRLGELGLAARLTAEAADAAGVLVRAQGGYFTDVIERTRRALAEQRHARDVRRYIASAPAFVANLVIDAPDEALELAVDAAQKAREIGDVANVGPLAIAVCDTALEAEAVDVLASWLPTVTSAPLDATEQIEADFLLTMAKGARSRTPLRIDGALLEIAQRFIELGDVTRADSPELGALCSLAWAGMPATARELLEDRVANHLPAQLATLLELVLRALEGPPWPLDGLELPETTSIHNERSLLHLLRGERPEAEALLRDRYEDRLRTMGSGRQRFSPYFPGALVSALGPPDAAPDVSWLLERIHRPPFPGVWVVHRAICALLLSERADPPEPALAEAAMRLVESTNADDSVRQWIFERAERSAAHGDRGV